MMVGDLSAGQQTEFLVEVDLFKHLPESCLDSLVNDSRTFDCSAGHLFFQAGQLANSLFVLEKGCVRIFRTFGNKTLTSATIDRPGIFGELGCFGTGIHYSSAEAICDSRVRLISRGSIDALLECAPHAAHKFIDLMGERCAHIVRKMEIAARKGLISNNKTDIGFDLLCRRRSLEAGVSRTASVSARPYADPLQTKAVPQGYEIPWASSRC
jgi:CRP-like cAMP-binding protein